MKNVRSLFASFNILYKHMIFNKKSIWNLDLYFLSLSFPVLKSPSFKRKIDNIKHDKQTVCFGAYYILLRSLVVQFIEWMKCETRIHFSTFICVGKMMPCYNCKFIGQQSIIGNFICRYKAYHIKHDLSTFYTMYVT